MPDSATRTPIPFALSHLQLDTRSIVITVEGDLDLASSPQLKWALNDLLAAGHSRVVVDLSEVTFMDSTGLAVLLAFRRSLGSEGVLAIASTQPAVLQLFSVTRADQSLDLFPSLEAAILYVRRAAPDAGTEGDRTGAARTPVAVESNVAGEAASDELPAGDASLTGDAAVVLGLAATAMPFAGSREAEAERWLRALRQWGDVGRALGALGATEGPLAEGSEGTEEQAREASEPERVVVEAVTRRAGEIALEDGSSAIRTRDLLEAVMQLYGAEFDRALSRHGVDRQQLRDRLGLS